MSINPVDKSKSRLHNLDDEPVLSFLKSPAFSEILSKAVVAHTKGVLARVEALENHVRRLNEFIVDTIRMLCGEPVIFSKDKREAKRKPSAMDQKDPCKLLEGEMVEVKSAKVAEGTKEGAESKARISEILKPPPKKIIIHPDDSQRFIVKCVEKLGVDSRKARMLSDCLITADLRGIVTHGLNRLENYVNDIKNGVCNGNADPTIIMEKDSVATVDGNNGMGCIVGLYCVRLGIKKAKQTGIALVVAKGSNHFGINSYYTDYAAQKGFIGLAFTNTSPLMVPAGAKDVCFGTNPLALSAPADHGDKVTIDFATTAVAMGKIEMQRRRNLPIPPGWAYDEHGNVTTDAVKAMEVGKLAPLGAPDQPHKGTMLAFLVEILCGILADAAYGPHIKVWKRSKAPANIAHAFIIIDPKCFPVGFEKRLADIMSFIRNMEPANPDRPVVVPGDMESAIEKRNREQLGVEYTASQITTLEKMSKELKVEMPKIRYV